MFKLWLHFARLGLIRQLEFKAQFLGRAWIEVVWLSTQIIFFLSLFKLTPDLAGWKKDEMFFFIANIYFVDAMYMMLMHENFQKFSTILRNGLFDTYLLRPVNSLFLGCFREVLPVALINLLAALSFYVWCFFFSPLSITGTGILINFIYVILGSFILLSFGVIICSLGFWTTQNRSLGWLFFELYRLGQRPEGLYSMRMRRFLLYVFPAAAFISIPTQLALGKMQGPFWFLLPWAIAFVVGTMALWTWKKGIANYEGAL